MRSQSRHASNPQVSCKTAFPDTGALHTLSFYHKFSTCHAQGMILHGSFFLQLVITFNVFIEFKICMLLFYQMPSIFFKLKSESALKVQNGQKQSTAKIRFVYEHCQTMN